MTEKIDRRTALLRTGAGVAGAAVATGVLWPAWATPQAMEALIEKRIGGRPVEDKGIELNVPMIAEDGANVPITIIAESPMTEAHYIRAIYLFVPENPSPEVVGFRFTPQSGRAKATINIRLAKTQAVAALAEVSDGTFRRTEATVKVTIGGCGGT